MEAVEVDREDGRYLTVWLPDEEEEPIPAPTAGGEGSIHFVNRVSVPEQMNSGKSAIDIEALRYPCSVSMIVPRGAAKELGVLAAVLESGSGLSIIRLKILQRMQGAWPDVQLVSSNKSGPTVAISDERSTLLTC